MAQNKLYRFLAKLSKRELQEFRSFLLSPYHNQSQILLALFDYIRDAHPEFTARKLDFELIFKHLDQRRLEIIKVQVNTSKRKYAKVLKNTPDKYVNDRLHDLYNRLESFIVTKELKNNDNLKDDILRKALLKYESQEIYLQKERKKLEKIFQKPSMGYEENFELWSLYHTALFHPKNQRFKAKENALSNANKYLDDTYALLKLHYGLYELHQQNIFVQGVNTLSPSLKAIIEEYALSENPVFQLYISAITYFTNNEQEKSWKSLRDLYFKKIEVLPPSEKLVFLTVLVNLGNKIGKNKNASFLDEIILLYQKGIEHDFWEFLGVIPSITFKNIAALAASKKQFSWASNFIQNYNQFLPKKDKAITIAFARAYLHFYEGHFEQARIELYEEIWDKDLLKELHDKLTYRSLYLRCLYELKHHSLSSFRSSFTNFIKGKQLKIGRAHV